MPAAYSATFSGTSFAGAQVSAVQDLFSMLASSTVPFIVTQIKLSATGITSPSEIVIARKRLPTTVTQSASSGTAITPAEVSQVSGRAATTVVYANQTTRTSTSGSVQLIEADTVQLQTGENDIIIPEMWIDIPTSNAFVLGLEVAPGATVSLFGTVYFIEKF